MANLDAHNERIEALMDVSLEKPALKILRWIREG
jgi:hypothetical protein